jgi:hypothetical protein
MKILLRRVFFNSSHLFVLLLIFVFHIYMNSAILNKSEICRMGDESHYLTMVVHSYKSICHSQNKLQDLKEYLWVLSPGQYHPPFVNSIAVLFRTLLAILSIPVSANSLILTTNSFCLLILLLSVYGIGATLYNRATGILAAFLVSFFPMVYGYSRVMMLDFPLACTVALSFFLLFKTGQFQSRVYSICLGLAAGLAMLTKETALSFIAVPFLCYFFSSYKANPGKHTCINACLALFLCLAMIGSVYLRARSKELVFERYALLVPLLPNLGIQSFCSSFSYYFRNIPAFTGTYMGIAALPIILSLLKNIRQQNKTLLLWAIVSLALHSVCANQYFRFLIALLPALSLLIAQELFRTRAFSPLKRFYAGALILIACAQYYFYFSDLRFLDKLFYRAHALTDGVTPIFSQKKDKEAAAVSALFGVIKKEQESIKINHGSIFFTCADLGKVFGEFNASAVFKNLDFRASYPSEVFAGPGKTIQSSTVEFWLDYLQGFDYVVVPTFHQHGNVVYLFEELELEIERAFDVLKTHFERIAEIPSGDSSLLLVYRNLKLTL